MSRYPKYFDVACNPPFRRQTACQWVMFKLAGRSFQFDNRYTCSDFTGSYRQNLELPLHNEMRKTDRRTATTSCMQKALTKVLSDGKCFLVGLSDASSRCLDALLLEELHRQVLVDGEESLLLLAGIVHAGLSTLKRGEA